MASIYDPFSLLSMSDYGMTPQMFNTPGGFDLKNFDSGVMDLNSPQNIFRGGEIANTGAVNSAFNAAQPSMFQNAMSGFKGIGAGLKDVIPGGFLGSTDTNTGIKTDGWGMPLISGAKGLFDAFNAYGTGQLAKESFDLNKQVALANLAGSKQSYNTNLEDRQRARVADAAPGSYQSVSDYMKEHRIA